MRILLIIAMLTFGLTLIASQNYVVGEVFSIDPEC